MLLENWHSADPDGGNLLRADQPEKNLGRQEKLIPRSVVCPVARGLSFQCAGFVSRFDGYRVDTSILL
jgi:hypothetical protein